MNKSLKIVIVVIGVLLVLVGAVFFFIRGLEPDEVETQQQVQEMTDAASDLMKMDESAFEEGAAFEEAPDVPEDTTSSPSPTSNSAE
ncbi:MAG: hypothetical protein KBT39_00685 [Bacteroidales bacterium]|nr:hypothetical protein [Bacteroidales bacterium]